MVNEYQLIRKYEFIMGNSNHYGFIHILYTDCGKLLYLVDNFPVKYSCIYPAFEFASDKW